MSTTTCVRPEFRNDLLAQITAGARSFEVRDRHSATSVGAFQDQGRALESLALAGLITIGARETTTAEPRRILAIRRIRLPEAGKRRVAVASVSGRPDEHARAADSRVSTRVETE